MTATHKAEIERTTALAIAELIRHGGSAEDVRQLVEQFKAIADAENVTDAEAIPD